MSSFDRRTLLTLGGAFSLAACGFQPLYREGGAASDAFGLIALPEASDPYSFAYRERLRRRLGDARAPIFRLDSQLRRDGEGVLSTQTSDITRYSVNGSVVWRLVRIADGVVASEGEVTATSGYDALASPFATRQARRAAEERVAIELAERASVRLLADLNAAGGTAE